ncbi:MAG: FAD-binding protein, partial [Rhodanobacter sp.]
MTTWRNWAGTVKAHPQVVAEPTSVEDVVAQVNAARENDQTIRMVGAGHSFTPAAQANGVMLRPQRLNSVREVDVANNTITLDAGVNLTALCDALDGDGLALTNMGDIRVQTIAGAIQTSTHGTGRESGTFAALVRELEMVLADGSVVTVSPSNDPELFNSARAGLGAFGIVTAVTLGVEPAFRLHAHEHPASFNECVGLFDQWTAEHDHVEFFWFPHTESCLVKKNDRTDAPAQPLGKLKSWWDDDFLSNTVFGALCRLGRAAPGYVPVVNKIAARALSERSFTDISWK